MTHTAPRRAPGAGDASTVSGPDGRLAAYQARTQTPLDLLALVTLWICVVPPGDFGTGHGARDVVLAVQAAVRIVYAADITIRGLLAGRPVRYALAHPLGLASVVFPPVRVIFSLRLVTSIFRRGNLWRFLVAAAVLVLNGAVIVYLFERHAPHSNIHTLGDSVWWSFVTVTTVGYGDFYPVTPQGRITACLIMGIGLLTLAVVTAQVASSFVTQGPDQAGPGPQAKPATPAAGTGGTPAPEATLAELDRRLARIEALLTAAVAPSPSRPAGAPEPGSGG
jgi:voltage-gated potassium channel